MTKEHASRHAHELHIVEYTDAMRLGRKAQSEAIDELLRGLKAIGRAFTSAQATTRELNRIAPSAFYNEPRKDPLSNHLLRDIGLAR